MKKFIFAIFALMVASAMIGCQNADSQPANVKVTPDKNIKDSKNNVGGEAQGAAATADN